LLFATFIKTENQLRFFQLQADQIIRSWRSKAPYNC